MSVGVAVPENSLPSINCSDFRSAERARRWWRKIEGGQCERERVVHSAEKSRLFVSSSSTVGKSKSQAAMQLQHLGASESSWVPCVGPGSFPHLLRCFSAHRKCCGGDSGGVGLW